MIGVGKSIWKVGPLLSGGSSAPAGEEIISAQVTYGALGTCQNGTLRTAKPLRLPNRMSLWTLKMAGQGNLFAGIVDQPTGNPGELGQVTLMAPHRQYLEALGVNIGYPYPLRSFGVPITTGVQDWEKVSDVLGRVLDSYPTADYGVGPDLEGGIGLPDYGNPITLDASQALSVSSQGYSIPNYVTDAVFDPGDGWHKYTYHRSVPGYAPRITAQVAVNPATVKDNKALPIEWLDLAPVIGVSLRTPQFTGFESAVGLNAARWRIHLPAPNEYEKGSRFSITLPYVLTYLPDEQTAAIEILSRAIQTGESENWQGKGYTTTLVSLDKDKVGLQLGITVEFPSDLVSKGSLLELIVVVVVTTSDNHREDAKFIFYPPKPMWEYEHPNTAGVQMPEGWNMPYSAEGGYSFKLPGWHVPPLFVGGLPGRRSQYAAGSVVSWSRNEASSAITTGAWPYPGQKRTG